MCYKYPCKQCTKRYPACSDHCEEYKLIKEKEADIKAKQNKEKLYRMEWFSYVNEHSAMMRRRHGKNK